MSRASTPPTIRANDSLDPRGTQAPLRQVAGSEANRAEQRIVITEAFGPPSKAGEGPRFGHQAFCPFLLSAAGAECCVAFLASCTGLERLGVPHSSVCLQKQRKRLLWSTDGAARVCRSASIDPRGNPIANQMRRVCGLLLLPSVRMPPQLSKNGPQHIAHYGKDREECRLQHRMPSTPAARVSESAKEIAKILTVTALVPPRGNLPDH
jgi:hypothetical protein